MYCEIVEIFCCVPRLLFQLSQFWWAKNLFFYAQFSWTGLLFICIILFCVFLKEKKKFMHHFKKKKKKVLCSQKLGENSISPLYTCEVHNSPINFKTNQFPPLCIRKEQIPPNITLSVKLQWNLMIPRIFHYAISKIPH